MEDKRESQKLSKVKEVITALVNKLGSGLAAKRSDVLESRKEMWREARIAIRDFDDVADLSIFAEEVARHEKQYAGASLEIAKLVKMLDSPYFARIDFTEDGYEGAEEIYIGRNSLFDEAANAFHVYDWRAPISGLYYDHAVGDASFTVPGTGAVICGQISLKRQYQIHKGEFVYMFDNDLTIEDDVLRFELSKASDAHIKTIINTIQKEQNLAIRAESGDILVFGPAGSGKTSVGLHRLAYLLYRHRDSLTSGKVRIFSPSPIFASYIEGIIPELGEEDVLTLDFPTLLSTMAFPAKGANGFHGPYELIDHLTTSPADIRTPWLAEKYTPAFLDSLEELIKSYAPAFEDVFFYKDKLCDAARLKALYEDRTVTGTLYSKSERVLSYVNQTYNEYFKAQRHTVTELFNDIHDDNFSDGEIRAKFDEERSFVISDLKNRLLPAAGRILEKHLRARAKKTGLPFAPARSALRMDKLYFEDALLFFYIDLLTGRLQGDKTVKHILLDEAQDLSSLHHRILKRLYPTSNFTVLADVDQALYPEINITDTDVLEALYPKAEVVRLTKSYRSTYEIMSFAAGVLNRAEPSAFIRHGEKPWIIQNPDPIKAVLSILSRLPADYNTVGILLPTATEAKKFHSRLKTSYPKGNTPRPLMLIAGESHNFTPGIMVMAAPMAKGLEFDTVICPGYEQNFDGANGAKLLYLICTRALHRLYLIKSFTN